MSIGQVVSLEAIGLIRKMPVEAVMRMALVGRHERMSAERAYELGMISEVVDPPERLREGAQELAEKIARNSPAAMAATKRALWGALEQGLTDACRAGAEELVSMWGHPDQAEGPQAFAEKREPEWEPPTSPSGRGPRDARRPAVRAASTRSTPRRRRSTPAASTTRGPSCGPGRGRGRRPRGRRCPAGAGGRRDAAERRRLVATLFGVWRAGAVYVPLNPRLTAGEVDHVLASTGAGGGGVGGRRDRAAGPTPRTFDDDVALVPFTSGTTGRPKPVLLTHAGVLDAARRRDRQAARRRSLRPGRRRRARPGADAEPRPGVAVAVGRHLQRAVRLAGRRAGRGDGPVRPGEFAALVRRLGIRSTVLPPAAMVVLVDDERVTDLAPLRFVRSITAPLSPLQARRFRDRFGISVLNSYGQTEIGGEIVGWNAADSRAHGDDKLGSVGRPHAGVEVRVDAPGDDGAGELRVRTPALSRGYADGADLADRLTPTAGSAPATSPASTTRASCGSRAGCPTWSTAAGSRSSPPRSRRCCGRRPTSPTWPWSACPTTGSARCRWRSSCAAAGCCPDI